MYYRIMYQCCRFLESSDLSANIKIVWKMSFEFQELVLTRDLGFKNPVLTLLNLFTKVIDYLNYLLGLYYWNAATEFGLQCVLIL